MKPTTVMNIPRCKALIRKAIDTFELDLSGMVVLTEAATGYYSLTPVIAAMSGAEKVYAMAHDSRFGRGTKVAGDLLNIARSFDVPNGVIECLFSRKAPQVGEADIITNLGFVRPIDGNLMARLKETAVIPLMWETWEFRDEDLDLHRARELGIPVLGTDEHHPDLRIFDYVGHLALKLLFEAQIEVQFSKILVVGTGEFADIAAETLKQAGAYIFHAAPEALNDGETKDFIRTADAMVVAEHHNRTTIIGPHGILKASDMGALNSSMTLVHICGAVDEQSLTKGHIPFVPSGIAPAGFMSVTVDYLGPRPLIYLHTAGLRTGGEMAAATKRGLSGFAAEMETIGKLPIAQGFEGIHFHRDART